MTGIDAMTSYTSTYLNNMKTQAGASSVEDTASKDLSKATDKELMEVCKEFEAYFIEQMFKAMKATVPSEEEGTSASAMNMFGDNLYQEYAKMAADSGQLGLAQTLFEQMKRNYNL